MDRERLHFGSQAVEPAPHDGARSWRTTQDGTVLPLLKGFGEPLEP